MTKLNEISELLKQAEAKVESLKAEMRGMGYDPTWKPEKGDTYYLINAGGNISTDNWMGHKTNTHRLRCNNVFKTEVEARLYLKIFNRIHELNEQDPVDWGTREEYKYYFYYGFDHKVISTAACRACKSQGTTYMTKATMAKIRSEFTDKELEVWVRR